MKASDSPSLQANGETGTETWTHWEHGNVLRMPVGVMIYFLEEGTFEPSPGGRDVSSESRGRMFPAEGDGKDGCQESVTGLRCGVRTESLERE